jgi:hypothetical protein
MIPAERVRRIGKKANSAPQSKSKIFLTESFENLMAHLKK